MMRSQHCPRQDFRWVPSAGNTSSTYAEGEVIWQQYDANAQLDKGTSVRIRVSKGAKPTETPTAPDEDD